jgi:hypothetical protein
MPKMIRFRYLVVQHGSQRVVAVFSLTERFRCLGVTYIDFSAKNTLRGSAATNNTPDKRGKFYRGEDKENGNVSIPTPSSERLGDFKL